MAELLERALSPHVLNDAWRRLRDDRAPWLAGMSRQDMQRDLVSHLFRLVAELRLGTYRPAPLRQFPVAKADGRQRVLSALTLRDKLAQRAVLTVIEPIGEHIFHHDSYAYRRGRGVGTAIARVEERIRVGLNWLVDADVVGFFDNIPHRPLKKVLRGLIQDRDVLRLVDLWLAAGTYRHGILTSPRGIPQGAVLSPFLCNLYLHSFDMALADNGIPFVRYADDFLLFAPDERTAAKALRFARRKLKSLGLELHPDKTRIVAAGPGVRFLGRPLPSFRGQL